MLSEQALKALDELLGDLSAEVGLHCKTILFDPLIDGVGEILIDALEHRILSCLDFFFEGIVILLLEVFLNGAYAVIDSCRKESGGLSDELDRSLFTEELLEFLFYFFHLGRSRRGLHRNRRLVLGRVVAGRLSVVLGVGIFLTLARGSYLGQLDLGTVTLALVLRAVRVNVALCDRTRNFRDAGGTSADREIFIQLHRLVLALKHYHAPLLRICSFIYQFANLQQLKKCLKRCKLCFLKRALRCALD